MKKNVVKKVVLAGVMSIILGASAFAGDLTKQVLGSITGPIFSGSATTTAGTVGSTASSAASSADRKEAIVIGARYAAPEYYSSAFFKDAKMAVAETLGKSPSELGSDDEAAQLIRNMADLIQSQ